jgi:hypothetical protein
MRISENKLRNLIRQTLMSEVREFITKTAAVTRKIPAGSGSDLEAVEMRNDELVQEIRNVLWMPQGIETHARILLAASNIDPALEGQSEYTSSGYVISEPSSSILTDELTQLDRKMSDYIIKSFGRLRSEMGAGAVNLPKIARSGNMSAYDVFNDALEAAFSSTVDTQASRTQGGKVYTGPLSPMKQEDLVDVIIDDMIEIILAPEGDQDRLDFERVEEEVQNLVNSVVSSSDEPAEAEMKLTNAFRREIDSALNKTARQERQRGATVSDVTVYAMINNIKGLFKLFLSRIVSKSAVPVDEYGRAFAALLSKASGIQDDYPLPSDLAKMDLRPILPNELDTGIVDFIQRVHNEMMSQINSMDYTRMVYHVISDQQDLYDEEGNPNPTYTYDEPHPAYDR